MSSAATADAEASTVDEATTKAAKRAASKVTAAKEALKNVVTLAAGAATLVRQELDELDEDDSDHGQVALDALEALKEKLEAAGGGEKGLSELLTGQKWLSFIVHASDDVKSFGFSMTASCVVRARTPGGWAENHGIKLDDVLLLLDKDLAYGMEKTGLIKTIQNRRPMVLTFLRPDPPTDVSLRLPDVYSSAAQMARVVKSWADEDNSDNASDTEFVPLPSEGFLAQALGFFTSASDQKPSEDKVTGIVGRAFRRRGQSQTTQESS